MTKPKIFNIYSQAEWEAFEDAKNKGVPLSYDTFYPLPYALEFMCRVSAQIKNLPLHRFHFEDLKKNFFPSNFSEMPKEMWRVLCEGEVPMSGWFACKYNARKAMEGYNVRHFKVMGMSTNPMKPVMI
jgi:hypothetical protein